MRRSASPSDPAGRRVAVVLCSRDRLGPPARQLHGQPVRGDRAHAGRGADRLRGRPGRDPHGPAPPGDRRRRGRSVSPRRTRGVGRLDRARSRGGPDALGRRHAGAARRRLGVGGCAPGREASTSSGWRPTFAGGARRKVSIAFADTNFGDRMGWLEVRSRAPTARRSSISSVPPEQRVTACASYPQDLLASPLDVHRATAAFQPGVAAPMAGGSERADGDPVATDVTGGAFALWSDGPGRSCWWPCSLAFGFGALHALGPGHGKTLMAAYLVGPAAGPVTRSRSGARWP